MFWDIFEQKTQILVYKKTVFIICSQIYENAFNVGLEDPQLNTAKKYHEHEIVRIL